MAFLRTLEINLCLNSRGKLTKCLVQIKGTLSKDDDDLSENVGKKKNLRSFKLNRIYLDPLNMSTAGDFSWS